MNQIHINELNPHPNNPRRQLGDLTELCESIKAQGLLQNLTVIPRAEGGYTVLIGHRRLEAAKLAGLTSLPCNITEMDEREQLATMLQENIQRNDLTIAEQARGFQMMLDLGDTIVGIADKTGLSKSTVRRRVQLAELDAKELAEAQQRGGKLEDFARIYDIEDKKTRDKLLKDVGTNNFSWSMKSAESAQRRKHNAPSILKALKDRKAEKVENHWSKYEVVYRIRLGSEQFDLETEIQKIKNLPAPVIYAGDCDSDFKILRKIKKTKNQKTAKEIALDRQDKLVREKFEAAKSLRDEFVCNFGEAKRRLPEIVQLYTVAMLGEEYRYSDRHRAKALLLGRSEGAEIKDEEVSPIVKEKPARALWALLYTAVEPMKNNSTCWSRNHKYERNSSLEESYNLLAHFGYEISDEEQQLLDGTHEVYTLPEVES